MLNNLKRISSEKYHPTNQDILHSRVPTKCIHEYGINIKNVPFMFIDVGGQRKQRKKWLQCLDNITSILFMVSSIEYDQYLIEDWKKNRLEESLYIFETVVNSPAFLQSAIILFLNKTDLLIEKLKHAAEQMKHNKRKHSLPFNCYKMQTIDKYFPSFSGNPTELRPVQAFLCRLFYAKIVPVENKTKILYHHYTTAVDTDNIKHVFNDVRHKILEENVKTIMLA